MPTLSEIIAPRGGVFIAGVCNCRPLDPECHISGGAINKYGVCDCCSLCFLEAKSLQRCAECRCDTVTDDPDRLGWLDIRPLNDADWSSRELATQQLLRLDPLYDDWSQWSDERRRTVVTKIVIELVRKIIAELPGMPAEVAEKLRSVMTIQDADALTREFPCPYPEWSKTAVHDVSHAEKWSEMATTAAMAGDMERAEHLTMCVARVWYYTIDESVCIIAESSKLASDSESRDAVLIRGIDILCDAAAKY